VKLVKKNIFPKVRNIDEENKVIYTRDDLFFNYFYKTTLLD